MEKPVRQSKSVVIEMAAAMVKAGVDYALEHQVELIAAVNKLNGKKGTRREKQEPIDITEHPQSLKS